MQLWNKCVHEMNGLMDISEPQFTHSLHNNFLNCVSSKLFGGEEN